MKKFSLKKITAAVSAAAMIATMGTSAFASEITVTNDTITISDTDGDGIFDITVNYTSTVNNEIGVTMLTYGMSDDSDIAASTGYATTGMKIVGVDQSAGAVAKDGTGSFNFKVSAIKNSNGGYYLKRGVDAIIAVSGDGVPTGSTPTYNTIKLDPLTATSASFVDATSISVGYYSYDDENAKIDKIKTAITGKKVNVAAVGTAKDEENNPLESYTATYTLAGTEEVAKENDKYYVTIPNTATFDVDSVDASCIAIPTGGIKAEIPVTLNRVAWTATTIELTGAKEVSLTKGDVTDGIDKAVKNALVAKGFVIKDANEHSANVTNPNDAIAVESTGTAYDANATVDQTLTYKVTATNAKSEQDGVAVATLASGEIADITVTVAALDADQFIVATAEGTKGGAAVPSVTVPNGTKEADAKAALTEAIDNITVKNATGDKTESGWTTSGEWSIAGYDATNESAATYTATIAIAEPTERGTDKGVNKDSIKLTLTLNVEAKPAGILGDVDGNGAVNKMDVTVLARYLAGWSGYTLKNESLADVDANDTVNKMDATVLARHLAGWTGYETLPYKK
ncbi:MAG: dockerin type I repeat-containing protein [Eubacteriales bacterium]|nr:dockerin type I repeat-containing protein [Eubacteriales bacterium]